MFLLFIYACDSKTKKTNNTPSSLILVHCMQIHRWSHYSITPSTETFKIQPFDTLLKGNYLSIVNLLFSKKFRQTSFLGHIGHWILVSPRYIFYIIVYVFTKHNLNISNNYPDRIKCRTILMLNICSSFLSILSVRWLCKLSEKKNGFTYFYNVVISSK